MHRARPAFTVPPCLAAGEIGGTLTLVAGGGSVPELAFVGFGLAAGGLAGFDRCEPCFSVRARGLPTCGLDFDGETFDPDLLGLCDWVSVCD